MQKPSVNLLKIDSSLKIGQAAKVLGVSIDTLRRWEKLGKITTIKTPGGTRFYSLDELNRIKPGTIKPDQSESLSTEELLKKTEDTLDVRSWKMDKEVRDLKIDDQTSNFKLPSLSSNLQHPTSLLSKLLITTTITSVGTLVIGGLIVTSSFLHQSKEGSLKLVDQLPSKESNVLATTTAAKYLEINTEVLIHGAINNLSLEATPSANTFSLTTGNTTLEITKSAKLDQDVSTLSSPVFSALNLSSTSKQITSNSSVFTLPPATTTLVGTDTTQTLTKKTLSGSDNTFTSIPNSALSNPKVTVSAGTNLTGGGDVSLGSSVTLTLKDSISLSGTLAVSGATTLSSTLAVTGATTLSSSSLSLAGVSYTFPTSDGSSSTVLTTNGSGTLSWGSLGTAAGWTDDGTTVRLTTVGDNVGIGTSNPGAKLNVAGNVGIGWTGTSSSSTFPSLGLAVFGNVGIGTTSPTNPLTVIGSANFTGSITVGSCTGCGASGTISLDDGSASSPSLQFSNDTDTGLWRSASNLLALTTNGSGSLQSGTSINGLSINSSGNVGIGTTTTNYNLQVVGTGYLSGFLGVGSSLNTTGNVGVGSSLTVTSAGVFSSGIKVSAHSDLTTIGATTITATGLNLNLGSDATGDIFYRAAGGGLTRLGIGSASQVLVVSSGLPSWTDSGSGISAAAGWNDDGSNIRLTTSTDNVGVGYSSVGGAKLAISGNVGIGTTTAVQNLSVIGNQYLSGNLGVGTTSPVGALHVVGQCVAKGTKIRRKRKGKRGKGEEEWEEVPVEDIKPDDEVLTLNDKTGEWEWTKVEKTMDMGIQEVFKLETEEGKWIETTANHPYLVREDSLEQLLLSTPTEHGRKSYQYQDQSINSQNQIYQESISHIHLLNHKLRNQNINAPIDPNITAMGLNLSSRAGKITEATETKAKSDDISDNFSLWGSFNLGNINPNLSDTKLSVNQGEKWIKVSQIKTGMEVATRDGWEKIASITKVGRKLTYDLQIAGTHNFVGNNIVAHNTYINGSTGLGAAFVNTTTPVNGLAVQGNVGVGTTSPAGALHVVGQCVTGDSQLITEDGKKIRVDEVKEGQKVYTLNQETGKFVPAQVNALLDMGVKPVFKLTTKSGKSIRTTGNHPYLVKIRGQTIDDREIEDSDLKIEDRELNKENLSSTIDPQKSTLHPLSSTVNIVEDSPIKNAGWVKVTDLRVGDRIAVAENLSSGGFSAESNIDQGESNDKEGEENQSQNVRIPESSKIHDSSFLNLYAKSNDNIPNKISNVNITSLNEGSIPGNTGDTIATPNQKTEKLINQSASTESSVESNPFITNHSNIEENQFQWDEVVSIEYTGEEQVWDLAIEGTHNFLANNIVAHNTYINGNVGVGFSSPTSQFQVNSGSSAFTVSSTGNVGIGGSLTTTSAAVFSSGIKVSAHSDLTTIGSTTITATGLNLNLGSDATGDIFYRAAGGGLTRLGIGSAGQALVVSSGLPSWGTGSQWTTSSNNIYFIGAAGSGNVGIGNTYANYSKLQLTGSGTGTGITFQTLDSSGTQRFSILDNGNVGIGTTNPSFTLTDIGTLAVTGAVGNSWGTGLYVNSSGNVGVGTSVPGVLLDVNGLVRSTTFVGIGASFTALRAVGSTTGSGSNGSIYFQDSSANIVGRVDTVEADPTAGITSDGALTVSGSTTINSVATTGATSGTVNSGQSTINVASTTGLTAGDIVLIMQMKHATTTNVGLYDIKYILTVNSATQITVDSNLSNTYTQTTASACSSTDTACFQVVRVPQYSSVTVTSTGTLTAPAWSTSTGVGGILWLETSGTISVQSGGSVTMAGKGYTGHTPASCPSSSNAGCGGSGGAAGSNGSLGTAGGAGEGPGGGGGGGQGGAVGKTPSNGAGSGAGGTGGGGGGGGNSAAGSAGSAGVSGAGGSGGFGLSGGAGGAGSAGSAGSSIGTPTITSRIVFGSGGGSGAGASGGGGSTAGTAGGKGGNGGAGGAGGGIVVLHTSGTISNSGTVTVAGSAGSAGVDGTAGVNGSGCQDAGGGGAGGAAGGGGAGGTVWLNGASVTAGTATVSGGSASTTGGNGGKGGNSSGGCGSGGGGAGTTGGAAGTGGTVGSAGTDAAPGAGGDGSSGISNTSSTSSLVGASGTTHSLLSIGAVTLTSGQGTYSQTSTGTTNSPWSLTANSVSTANVMGITANGLTTGNGISLSSSSTAGTNYSLLNLSSTGNIGTGTTNARYGILDAMYGTGVNTTTNIAALFSAQGATNNYALVTNAGNVGIGITNPGQLFQVNNATNAFSVNSSGYVGIGITNPVSRLSIFGSVGIGNTGSGGFASSIVPVNGLAVQGNVGIGTTSPAGALHVVGQCVTGDSELITEDGEKIRVDEVTSGQKVYTLNQETGKFVPAQVNALLDMGVKPVFRLTTKSGKSIRTTGNHPYLVKLDNPTSNLQSPNPSSILQHPTSIVESSPIKDAGWVKVTDLKVGDQIAVAGEDLSSAARFSLPVFDNDNYGNNTQEKNNSGNTEDINNFFHRLFPFLNNQIAATKPTIPATLFIVNNFKNSTPVISRENAGTIGIAANQVADRLVNKPDNINSTSLSSNRNFMKQTDGSTNQATYQWDPIVSIEYTGEDQVWDLAIEGTHNFLANNIVAHNTYINGSTGLGTAFVNTTTPTNGLAVQGNVGIGTTSPRQALEVTGNGFFSGNVGIGFTTPDRLLQIAGNSNISGATLSSLFGVNGAQFDISGSSATTLTTKLGLGIDTTNNYGYFQVATNVGLGNSGAQNLIFEPAGGNVGIGTTTPGARLSIFGSVGIGNTGTGGFAISAAPTNGLSVQGNVGIGTTTANSNLVVVGNTNIGSAYSGVTTPADGLLVQGNVGIGTTGLGGNGAFNLDVWGTARFTGNVGVGGSITGFGALNGLNVTGLTSLAAANASSLSLSSTLSLTGGIETILPSGAAAVLGTLNLPANRTVNGIYVEGKYAYLATADTTNAFKVVDISNPSSPAVVSDTSVDTAGGDPFNAVVVYGKYAYVARGATNAGTCSPIATASQGTNAACEVEILDISNPRSPSFVGGIDINTSSDNNQGVRGLFVSGRYLYVANDSITGTCSGTTLTGCEFRVYDLTNPARPTPLSGINITNRANEVYVQGQYAYVVSAIDASNSTLHIYNISNPTAVTSVGELAVESTGNTEPDSIWVSGRYAYVGLSNYASGPEVRIVDVSNPASPSLVSGGTIETGGTVNSMMVAGKYLFYTANTTANNELNIYDVGNPAALVNMGGVEVGSSSFGLFVSGKYAYLGTNQATTSFKIIDIAGLDALSGRFGTLGTGSLNVADSATIDNTLNVGNGLAVGLGGIFSHGPLAILSSNSSAVTSALDVRSGGTTGTFLLYAQNNGNVGIGTTSPGSTFNVIGNVGIGTSAAGAALQVNGGGLFGWGTASVAAPSNGLAIFGNVGIGTTSASAPLEVRGSGTGATIAKFTDENSTGCTLATGGTISCSSDIRLKKNIDDLSYGLDDVLKLDPVEFNWNSQADDSVKSLGFIAQQVEQVIPNLVTTDSYGYKQLNTIGLVPILTKAIKEQQAQIASQSAILSNISLDTDGNLDIPKVKVDKLLINDPSLTLRTSSFLAYDFAPTDNVDNTSEVNSTPGVNNCNSTPLGDEPTSGVGTNCRTSVNVLSSLKNLDKNLNSLQSSVVSLQTEQATKSADIAGVKSDIASQSATLAQLKDNIASLSSVIASAAKQSTNIDKIATGSSNPRNDDVASLNLTPPDTLYATGSATLANLKVTSDATISGMLAAYDLNISNSLKSLGTTTLGKTSINGDLIVDGILSIENGSDVNVIPTLYLQKSPLANLINLFDGKVIIDKLGNITTLGEVKAASITTNRLTISNNPVASSSATLAVSIGTGTLPANTTKVTILASITSDKSKVFITPTTSTDKVLSVINIKNGESFDVSITSTSGDEIRFNWWVVQTE